MLSYSHLLQLALPQVILVVAAIIVLAVDLSLFRAAPLRSRLLAAVGVASVGCVAAIFAVLQSTEATNLYHGMLVVNPLTQLVQIALLALTVLVLLLAVDSEFTQNVGEFVLLILLATVGMMFLVGSRNLLTTFISLELLSLPLYILVGFDKRHAKSSEAALKYFLFGGMSAAFLLFGFSFLYGTANSADFVEIAGAIHPGPLNPLLVVALVTTVIGLGFKVAAVPLHFWAPDVYETAPAPVAAFIASGSKVASFFVFFEILSIAFAGADGSAAWMNLVRGWVPVVAGVAALSMILGNLVAILQTGLRRLLAYSAIAHAGYMLIAIVSHTRQGMAGLIFYVITYSLATIGAFGIVGIVEKGSGNDQLSSFDGLGKRAPILSACLFIFLLSFAGIPPLSGFFGKFYLFLGALQAVPAAGLLWIVAVAIAMSAISLYYYLRVLRRVYSDSGESAVGSLPFAPVSFTVVIVLAVITIVFGCMPNLLLQPILNAIR